ncbi:hypothetical protein NC651_017112 [Populus alba x Populus x berolinensis]|nr:hypothetical protein NC651_017112 [Populus alba x Populus x berolinensis]
MYRFVFLGIALSWEGDFTKSKWMSSPASGSAKFPSQEKLSRLLPELLVDEQPHQWTPSYIGFATGKSVPLIRKDLKRDFIPTFVLEGGIWPTVQVASFRCVPVRYQLLYAIFFCLLDSCFLSWLEQQEDAPWKQWLISLLPSKEQEDLELLKKSHKYLMKHCSKVYLIHLIISSFPGFFLPVTIPGGVPK